MHGDEENCAENKIIAESTNITVQYVQKLWTQFRSAPEKIASSARMGRPPREIPAGSVRSVALAARCALKSGAYRIWNRIIMSEMTVP